MFCLPFGSIMMLSKDSFHFKIPIVMLMSAYSMYFVRLEMLFDTNLKFVITCSFKNSATCLLGSTNIPVSIDFRCCRISKKYRYQAIKQKEQSKLKIQKTRLSHEMRRHK